MTVQKHELSRRQESICLRLVAGEKNEKGVVSGIINLHPFGRICPSTNTKIFLQRHGCDLLFGKLGIHHSGPAALGFLPGNSIGRTHEIHEGFTRFKTPRIFPDDGNGSCLTIRHLRRAMRCDIDSWHMPEGGIR